jgi:hypothetical protein
MCKFSPILRVGECLKKSSATPLNSPDAEPVLTGPRHNESFTLHGSLNATQMHTVLWSTQRTIGPHRTKGQLLRWLINWKPCQYYGYQRGSWIVLKFYTTTPVNMLLELGCNFLTSTSGYEIDCISGDFLCLPLNCANTERFKHAGGALKNSFTIKYTGSMISLLRSHFRCFEENSLASENCTNLSLT